MPDAKIERLESDSISAMDLLWPSVIAKLNLQSASLVSSSYYDYARRVYADETHVYKIILSQYEVTSRLRNQDLHGEFEILKKLSGIHGVPAAIEWHSTQDYQLLVIERARGESIAGLPLHSFMVAIYRLGIIMFRLCLRGVSHNDLHLNNVLATKKGSVYLLDFDQTTRVGLWAALARSFLGIEIGGDRVHGNFMTIIKEYLKAILPPEFSALLKKIRPPRRLDNQLPTLQEDADSNSKMLLEAWQIAQHSDASAPNMTLAYYSFDFQSYHFPGERPWEQRWKVLRSITDYEGMRVLELGCNLSLLSCFLLREMNAAAALGVDIDANILRAATMVSTALGVSPEYSQIDFDSVGIWENQLSEFKADIVCALNVLNWVQDKERFLNFLGRFKQVIFEGHDNFEIERERFARRGFSKIILVGMTERRRPILHCQK